MEIFKLEFKNIWKSLLTWTGILSCVIILLMAFFPSMQNEAMQELANAKLDSVSPAVLAVLGFEQMPDITIVINYFGYIMQFINLTIAVFVMLRGTSALIKEETDGTIEYLYVKPISRTDIVVQKLLANVIGYIALLAVLFAFTAGSYMAFTDYTLPAAVKEIGLLLGGTLFVGMVFLLFGFFLSTILRSSRQTASVSLGVVFATFLIGIVSVLVERLDFLIYLSPLDWIKTSKLVENGLGTTQLIIGICIMAASVFAALIIYKRKDLNV